MLARLLLHAAVAGAPVGIAGLSSPAVVVTVDARSSTHRINPLFMGCHSDSGFGHQVRSFYSNMLYGESFEPGAPGSWQQHLLPPTATANVTVEGKGEGMHGQTALKIVYHSGTGLVGLGNRGFRNEGIPLRAGMEYQGYLFVKSAAAATVNVSLRRYAPNSTRRSVLASVALPFAGGNWTQLHFSLVPTEDAPCAGVTEPDPDLHCCSKDLGNSTCRGDSLGHVCIRCLGEFAVGLTGPGEVLIDFVPAPYIMHNYEVSARRMCTQNLSVYVAYALCGTGLPPAGRVGTLQGSAGPSRHR
jgi:hypothetical protein